jgi:hypothetical protein
MLLRWLRSLAERHHKHRWMVTHTNGWMLSTREECRCGVVRHVEVAGADSEYSLCYRWRYSDGGVGPWRSILRDRIMETGEFDPKYTEERSCL